MNMNVVADIEKVLTENSRLTDNEIVLKTNLPLTLEGIYPYLKDHFHKETIKTGKKINGIKWTNKGFKKVRLDETITYWSLK